MRFPVANHAAEGRIGRERRKAGRWERFECFPPPFCSLNLRREIRAHIFTCTQSHTYLSRTRPKSVSRGQREQRLKGSGAWFNPILFHSPSVFTLLERLEPLKDFRMLYLRLHYNPKTPIPGRASDARWTRDYSRDFLGHVLWKNQQIKGWKKNNSSKVDSTRFEWGSYYPFPKFFLISSFFKFIIFLRSLLLFIFAHYLKNCLKKSAQAYFVWLKNRNDRKNLNSSGTLMERMECDIAVCKKGEDFIHRGDKKQKLTFEKALESVETKAGWCKEKCIQNRGNSVLKYFLS